MLVTALGTFFLASLSRGCQACHRLLLPLSLCLCLCFSVCLSLSFSLYVCFTVSSATLHNPKMTVMIFSSMVICGRRSRRWVMNERQRQTKKKKKTCQVGNLDPSLAHGLWHKLRFYKANHSRRCPSETWRCLCCLPSLHCLVLPVWNDSFREEGPRRKNLIYILMLLTHLLQKWISCSLCSQCPNSNNCWECRALDSAQLG